MSLVNLKEILSETKKVKFAILATDPPFINFAQTVVDAAIRCNSPVIIQIADSLDAYFNYESFLKPLLDIIRQTKVPIAVGLDHGKSIDSVARALKLGCSFVMFDGSYLPLKENINMTKKVVKIARKYGASVEGEVGIVGGLERDVSSGEYDVNKKKFSEVSEVVDFVSETDVDAVAISVGTIHGLSDNKITLDFKRISEISAAVEIPLVIHGGSGLKNEEYIKLIKTGISKINYYSDLIHIANMKAYELINLINNSNFFTDIIHTVLLEVKQAIIDKMNLFSSVNKAKLFI